MSTFQPTATRRYYVYGAIFQFACLIMNVGTLLILANLLLSITSAGLPHLSATFLTEPPSRFPEKSGVFPSIMGTLWNVSLTGAMAIIMGMMAAIYLEEYAPRNNRLIGFIKINIQNLSGVPSIIYGILGLTLFVRWMGLGRSVLAGALTMALLILPTITIATQEALRAVPDSFRFAGYGIGMTRWQVVRFQVLPIAMPGILTGVILGLSRAIGETAPLLMIGALTYVAFSPTSLMDGFTVLPIQIFNWASMPQKSFHQLSAAGIIVLLAVLLSMNAVAVYLRIYFQRKLSALHG